MVEAVDDVEVKLSVVLVSVLARATMMLMKFSQLNMAMSGNEDMSDNKVPQPTVELQICCQLQ